MYGLDLSNVRVIGTWDGKKQAVEVPYPLFSTLLEFWIAARQHQTREIERKSGKRSGTTSSLAAVVPPGNEPEADTTTHPVKQLIETHKPDPKRAELDRLFLAPHELEANRASSSIHLEPAQAQTPTPLAASTPPKARGLPTFSIEVPAEVWTLLYEHKVSPIRAWRVHRGLEINDVAELLGVTPGAVTHIEVKAWAANRAPRKHTLTNYADALDCKPEHLAPTGELFGDAAKRHYEAMIGAEPAQDEGQVERSPRAPFEIEFAPRGTPFPAQVVRHMQAGKHPVLAWRLYRDLTKDRAADIVGCSPRNFDAFERGENLRAQTIDKLCTLFKCKPEQLRYPIDIEFHGKAGRRLANALSTPAAAVS